MIWIMIVAIWGSQGMAMTSIPGFASKDECHRAREEWSFASVGKVSVCVAQTKPSYPERGSDGWALDADPEFKRHVIALGTRSAARVEAFRKASLLAARMTDAEFKALLDSIAPLGSAETGKPVKPVDKSKP